MRPDTIGICGGLDAAVVNNESEREEGWLRLGDWSRT
jgi:hypothetical protein